jgi:hypothetical protein
MRLTHRLNNHIRDGKKKNTRKALKIKEILEKGYRPIIIEIDAVEKEKAIETEKRWMIEYGKYFDLTNTGSAGHGGSGNNASLEWEEYEYLLGTMPDNKLAKKLGCSTKTVNYQRTIRGISPCGNLKKPIPPPMGGWNKIELSQEIIDLLGTEPDYKIGERFGLSKRTIARARRERGIASYAERTGNNGKRKKGEVCWNAIKAMHEPEVLEKAKITRSLTFNAKKQTKNQPQKPISRTGKQLSLFD